MINKTYLIILLLTLLFSCTDMMAATARRVFMNYTAADGLADNCAHTIHCTKTGRLVITTRGQINFFDGQNFTYIDPSDENLYPLPEYHGNYHLYFDKYHHIWLKNTQTLTCVNLTTEKFVRSIEEEFQKFGVNQKVYDLFVDSEGIPWLLLGNGLYNVKTKKTQPVRKGVNLQDLEVVKEKFLMLFYGDGQVQMIDKDSGHVIYEGAPYQDKADQQRYDKTSALYVDGDTVYQIRNGAKEGAVFQFVASQRQWKELLRKPYHLNNLTKRDSLLLIPAEYGFWQYSINDGTSEHIEDLSLESGRKLNFTLNVMCFDRQGGLWVGTEQRGLLYARPFTSPFRVFSWNEKEATDYAALLDDIVGSPTFRGKSANCVFRDSRGWTWVGTVQGLHCYRNKDDKLPQIFTKRDGLLNNIIHSVVEDKLHNIWVATSYGISCLLMENDAVSYILSYNNYDYVPLESFLNGKAKCMPDGTIIMQSVDHVVVFNPSEMSTLKQEYKFRLYPKLIRLMVNGVDVRTGDELDGNVILEKAITRVDELNLNYDQNSISLTFSALNYFRPSQTYYRVRIKGFIDDWRILTRSNSGGLIDRRGLLHLPMMSLRPGTYKIELQASIIPDQWDTVPYEWTINVNEPWWRTTGVFVLFVAILLILLCVNGYYYVKNSSLRLLRNSEEVGVLKRIRLFAERSSLHDGSELLEPVTDEIMGLYVDPQSELTPEFMEMMPKIIPMVLETDPRHLTMRQLSDKAHIDVQKFYAMIMANIYKSPRGLARKLMLSKAEILLKDSTKTIAEIAAECKFVSPNHFIALFVREYGMPPEEFRRK